MTYLEKLKRDHPDWTEDEYEKHVLGYCPMVPAECVLVGSDLPLEEGCRFCWNRDIPTENRPISDRRRHLTANEYQALAMRTCSVTDRRDMLMEGLMGLCGEAGECIDIHKKVLFQGHAPDGHHLANELGDVAWYLAVSARALGYDLEDILRMNIEKLEKRYPNGFEADKSVNRQEGDI